MSPAQAPILERQAVEHDFNPIVYHYVKKTDIELSRTEGIAVRAICGSVEKFSNPIGDRPVDAKQGRTICPLCQLVYDGLPARKGPSNG